jgi:hypothetical protein
VYRLACVALIAVVSGTPAFAAVCAELCGLKTTLPPTSAHCSKHDAGRQADTAQAYAPAHHAIPAPSEHRSDDGAHRGDEVGLAVTVGHGPGCCGPLTLPAAMVGKASRTDGITSQSVVAPSGPYVPTPIARPELRVPPPGSSGSPALSRAPLILRI